MTKCSWPPFGASRPFSVRDLNQPIITFVGRLNASHKGVDTLLDALALMARGDLPLFSAWIIGGGLEEADTLRASLAAWPELKELHTTGRLTIWARVAPEALAELYSRSTVVAMPSRWETFGLVAVQAMLCGTPVVATAIGGLRNTVVPRRTGLLIEPGDATALAFALGAMVRHPELARWLGDQALIWASSLFSDQSPQGGFPRIIACQSGLRAETHPLEDPAAFFAAAHAREVQGLLGADAETEWIRSDHNTVFGTRIGGRAVVAKRFTDRPDFDASIYRLPAGMMASRRRARVNRSVAAGETPVALDGVEAGETILLFEPCEQGESLTNDQVNAVADRLMAGPPAPRQEAVAACRTAIDALAAHQGWETLASFDRAAGALNVPLSGDEAIFVRCHPLAEMVRLKLHLEAGAWPLSDGAAERLGGLLARCLVQDAASAPGPWLRHGDLSRRHVLSREEQLILCDLEQARFAFGALDRAGFAIESARSAVTSSLGEAVSVLIGAATSADACVWIVCELLHRALGRASWGQSRAVEDALSLCEAFLARVKPQ